MIVEVYDIPAEQIIDFSILMILAEDYIIVLCFSGEKKCLKGSKHLI